MSTHGSTAAAAIRRQVSGAVGAWVAWSLGGALAPAAPLSPASCTHPAGNVVMSPLGDVRGTGVMNVADAQCVVLGVLAAQASAPWPDCLDAAYAEVGPDVNCDGVVDVSDVTLVIRIALGLGLGDAVDSNSDGCPDACVACAPPGGSSCLVQGVCVPQGAAESDDPCSQCVPDSTTLGWSTAADGDACVGAAGAGICSQGECVEEFPDGGCWPDCPEMVTVPAGWFWRGCEPTVDQQCLADEEPGGWVYLDAFEVDTTETTAGQYQQCFAAGQCAAPQSLGFLPYQTTDPFYASHPANGVSWFDAATYCAWAGKRLCTEAEWEKAARGTDGRKFPWGNDAAGCNQAWVSPCAGPAVYAAGSRPQGSSPYGAVDMGGNVWEWTADWYDASYYQSSPGTNPPGPASGAVRTLRGGGVNHGVGAARASNRMGFVPPDYKHFDIGFRCCRSQ